MMRTIEGHGLDGTIRIDGVWLDPQQSLVYRQHSETGFAWGYGGSGPSQLALAILLFVGIEPAVALSVYHDFKFAIVAAWPCGEDFKIRIDIEHYVEQQILKRLPQLALNREVLNMRSGT